MMKPLRALVSKIEGPPHKPFGLDFRAQRFTPRGSRIFDMPGGHKEINSDLAKNSQAGYFHRRAIL
jgi:hypothetical protein